MRSLWAWAVAGLASFGFGWGLTQLGMPSPYLFSALLVGIAAALLLPGRLQVTRTAFVPAQAVTGVTIGAYLEASALSELVEAAAPIVLVTAGTLVLSLAAGIWLMRLTRLDPPTAILGLVAGGAVGIVSMADGLGADGRLVAFMQYLRVLTVVLLMPLLVVVIFGTDPGGATLESAPVLGDLDGWLITLGVASVGAAVAMRIRITAGALMGPMILSGIVALSLKDGFTVPPLLQETAFSLIGIQVGLRFTRETIREAGSLLIPVVLAILGLMAGCFGLAFLLDVTTSASLLDSYLATTPGGMYAVLAAAVGSGADTTFVLALQALRLLVMVLLAPLAVRWLVRRYAGRVDSASVPSATSARSAKSAARSRSAGP